MYHSEVEVCLCLEGKKVLAEIVVVWVVKVDGVPQLVECMTMLEVVEGVPMKNVVTHIVVEGVSIKLVVLDIVVVVAKPIASHVVVMKPFVELVTTCFMVAMVLVKFAIAHVVVAEVLGGSIVAHAIVAKVLGGFVVTYVFDEIVFFWYEICCSNHF